MSPYARITGWGKYTPEKVMTNFDLEKIVDTNDEWITTRTGIKERRIASADEPTSFMSVEAARDAMKVAGISAENLDLIIVATSSPDYLLPPVSSQIQDMLGANCGAFSLVAGCTGWLYAITVAQQFIQSGAYKTVCVIGAETITKHLNWEDRTTCVLFGDGAGAVIMQASATPTGIISFELGSDGAGAEHLHMPGGGIIEPFSQEVLDKGNHYIEMNGREVFRFAARVLGRSFRKSLADAGMAANDVDLYIPHQANMRIVEAASRLMRVPMEKFYMNIQRYGNTSAASIPIALTEAIEEGRAKPGDTLGFVAFGAGLTWGSAIVHLGGPDPEQAVSLADELFVLARAKYLARRAAGVLQDAATTAMMAVMDRRR